MPDNISLPSIAYVVPITIYERSCDTTIIGSTDRLSTLTKKLLLYADCNRVLEMEILVDHKINQLRMPQWSRHQVPYFLLTGDISQAHDDISQHTVSQYSLCIECRPCVLTRSSASSLDETMFQLASGIAQNRATFVFDSILKRTMIP